MSMSWYMSGSESASSAVAQLVLVLTSLAYLNAVAFFFPFLPQDDMGWSPLMWAVSNEHTAVALYLIEFGAKLRLQDFDGRSALHMACSNGQVKVAPVSVYALVVRVRVCTNMVFMHMCH